MIELPQFFHNFMIFKWSDFLEISIFSTFIFYFSSWLIRDKQKKLLPIFYSFCLMFIISDYLGFLTLSNFLFSFSPVFLILFVLLHQNTIQKCFISTKNITPAHLQKIDWISELIKSLLAATDSKKDICCVIECNDSLYNFVEPKILMNTEIQKDVLELLIESKQFEMNKFIWIDKNGYIKSINTNWNIPENFLLLEEDNNHVLTDWEKNSIKLTSNLDALSLKSSSDTRTFSIIAQGKKIDNIFTDKTINIIEKFIKKNEFKKAVNNENQRDQVSQ